jgi:hypothetical protein
MWKSLVSDAKTRPGRVMRTIQGRSQGEAKTLVFKKKEQMLAQLQQELHFRPPPTAATE